VCSCNTYYQLCDMNILDFLLVCNRVCEPLSHTLGNGRHVLPSNFYALAWIPYLNIFTSTLQPPSYLSTP
jgi:hypothetical protein